MDQNTKNFCGILDKLGDQLIEIVDFYNEAEEIAEVVLELNYENTCYHTNITINDDLTATVNQERKDNLTGKDFPPDDYYPMGIDGLSESKSWNLSKYEVSCELTTIILPRFEDYLAQIKDGFKALQKLKLDNSTRTDAFGMLKHLHDVGVSLVAKFKKHESTLLFVRDLKIYFSDHCEPIMLCRRLKEFQLGMSIKPVEQKKNNKDPFKEKKSAIKGKDCWHNKDFTSVVWYGTEYIFNKTQGLCIECLWRNECLSEKTIGEDIGSSSENYRLIHTFREHPAWMEMIVKDGCRKGIFRLSEKTKKHT
jgi:hypothetical protein